MPDELSAKPDAPPPPPPPEPPRDYSTADTPTEYWDAGTKIHDLIPDADRESLGMRPPLSATEAVAGERDGTAPPETEHGHVVYPGVDGYRGERPVTPEEFASWPPVGNGIRAPESGGGFTGEVRPVWIDPTTTDLFRYVDDGPGSAIDGHWWFRANVADTEDLGRLDSEGAARGDLAIKGEWSSISNLVHLDAAEPIRAYAGPGRPVDGAVGHLPGGAEQIYIPDSELYKIRAWESGGVSIGRSPWKPDD